MAQASNLSQVYEALSPEPLTTKEQFDAYYRDLNPVRGMDVVALMALNLWRASAASPYKAFLMGHSGVGKSTELTRLIQRVNERYRAVRFSAVSELDPTSFRPFDVLLLMMARVVEEATRTVEEGGPGLSIASERLDEIWRWLSGEKITRSVTTGVGAAAEAGAGLKGGSLLANVLGLFASIKGEMKYASERKTEIVEYRLSRLSQLIDLANRLLDDCNGALRRAAGQEWLVIGEDFDKPGIPKGRVEDLFLTYANVFKELRSHLIITIPITLGQSTQAVRLPFPANQRICLPDTPVYDAGHGPHAVGRAALRSVLEARVAPDLFEAGQMERLLVASGGNLRDLFALAARAADNALLRAGGADRPSLHVAPPDVSAAIDWMRGEYQRRLGDSPYDDERIDYKVKAERMVRLYNAEPAADIPDACLYSLLRARVIQEFNGKRWLGVHPLAVDILASQGLLGDTRPVPGGTE